MLEKGGLLPAFLPVWIWTDFFIKNVTENQHIILDGLARRDDEVPVLARALQFYKRPHTRIVEMRISDDEARTRLKARERADDTDTEIARRLEWFSENVIPAIAAWKKFPDVLIHAVDGEHPIEEVQQEVLKTLHLL